MSEQPDPWGKMIGKINDALDQHYREKLAEANAERDAFIAHPETRCYVVGLPVMICVNDEGRVEYEVDTSEASSAMNDDWVSHGSDDTRDQLAADMERVDADHQKRITPSI